MATGLTPGRLGQKPCENRVHCSNLIIRIHIDLTPALTISRHEMDAALDIIEECIDTVERSR